MSQKMNSNLLIHPNIIKKKNTTMHKNKTDIFTNNSSDNSNFNDSTGNSNDKINITVFNPIPDNSIHNNNMNITTTNSHFSKQNNIISCETSNISNIITDIPIVRKSDTKRVPPIRYHKQLFQNNTTEQKKIDSTIYTLKNNDHILKLNVYSSAFDGKFNTKKISKCDIVKNYDGSVDLTMWFD